jgi:hypothetical protein
VVSLSSLCCVRPARCPPAPAWAVSAIQCEVKWMRRLHDWAAVTMPKRQFLGGARGGGSRPPKNKKRMSEHSGRRPPLFYPLGLEPIVLPRPDLLPCARANLSQYTGSVATLPANLHYSRAVGPQLWSECCEIFPGQAPTMVRVLRNISRPGPNYGQSIQARPQLWSEC